MKRKSFIAATVAATMLFSSMTALASGDIEAEFGGDLEYVNTDIYVIALPTDTACDFTLDPQGLTSLDNNGTWSADAKGKIIHTPFSIVNWSSKDVKLDASFYLVDSKGDLAYLDSEAALTDSDSSEEGVLYDQKQLYFTYSYMAGEDEDYQTPVAIKDEANKVNKAFTMTAADYTYVKEDGEYKYVLNDTEGYTVNIKFDGHIADDYDWSEYVKAQSPETIKLKAVFSFKDASNAALTYTTEAPATPAPEATTTPAPEATTTPDPSFVDLVTTNETLVELSAEDAASLGYDFSVDFTKGEATTFTASNGGTIASASFGANLGSITNAVTASSSNVTLDDGTLTILSNAWNGATAGSKRYLEITFTASDGSEDRCFVCVTIKE